MNPPDTTGSPPQRPPAAGSGIPAPADGAVLFDFTRAPLPPDWQAVNDGVMGGVSSGRFERVPGAAVFSGVLRLENNGGFASVRSAPLPRGWPGCRAFLVRARGDGRRYRFTLRTAPDSGGPLYQCGFMTRQGEWEEHRLPLGDFVPTYRGRILDGAPPDPAAVRSVGLLIADRQEGPFRLEMAWIKASATGGAPA